MDLKKFQNPRYFHLLWCFLGVCILWQIGTIMAGSAFLPRRVRKTLIHYKEATEMNAPMENSPRADSPRDKQTHALKNMFAPPRMPKLTCTAVLGDQTLINDQWYKVGSDVHGATVIEINPASVKIRWQEQEQTLVPFDVEVSYAGNSSPPANGEPSKKNQSDTQTESNEPARRPPDGFGMGEERRRIRERYLNASPEEQAEMRRQLQERFGGRRG